MGKKNPHDEGSKYGGIYNIYKIDRTVFYFQFDPDFDCITVHAGVVWRPIN